MNPSTANSDSVRQGARLHLVVQADHRPSLPGENQSEMRLLTGAQDWWFALSVSAQHRLRANPRAELLGDALAEVQVAERAASGGWIAAGFEAGRWYLTNSAMYWVDVISAVSITAQALAAWDRRQDARGPASPLQHLFAALTGVGALADLLQHDPDWQRVLDCPDEHGLALVDVLQGYRWARSAPGGLREAAQLYGAESTRSAVWHRDTWWFTADLLDPTFATTLAGRPVTDLVRRVLAGFVQASISAYGVQAHR